MSIFASASRDRCPPDSVSTFCSHTFRVRARRRAASPPACAARRTRRPASKSCWTSWYCSSVFSSASPVSSAISCSRSRSSVGQLVQVAEGELALVDHGVLRLERRILRQIPELDAIADGGRPRIADEFAGERFEQRRLAAAVGADQPDALAGVDGEGKLVEQRALAEGFFDVVDRGDRHKRKTRLTKFDWRIKSECSNPEWLMPNNAMATRLH